MTFLDLKGRKKTLKNARKYLISWNKGTRSKFQDNVKAFLYPFWKNDLCAEEMPLVGSLMKFDLVNISKRVVCEVMGGQHTQFNPHFHKTRSKYLGQVKRDLQKHDWCELNNYQMIEIYSEKELTYDFFLAQGIELWNFRPPLPLI